MPPIRQLPTGDEIFLDHIGHFVADRDAASAALVRAGFAATPVSVQVNPDPHGGNPVPTGTGNVCAMLRAGYVEVLFKTADTPLGAEFEASRGRYEGLHLVAFAIADAQLHHARLESARFAMQPIIPMQRPVETTAGRDVAAFQVVRVKSGTMPEGRVQMLRHQTEEAVWQPRWLAHPNGAIGLRALTIVVGDTDEAIERYSRFTGKPSRPVEGGFSIALDRGELVLVSPEAWQRRWPTIPAPSVPFMGEATIEVASLTKLADIMARGQVETMPTPGHWPGRERISARFPVALGAGVWTFVEAA